MDISKLYILSEKETKTRKRWLFLLVLFLILNVLILVSSSKRLLADERAGLILLFGFQVVSFAVFYFFSYKRFGTKLLTVYLVTTALCFSILATGLVPLGISFVSSSSELMSEMKVNLDWMGLFICIAIFSMSIWKFILSYRLRKVNQKVRKLMKLSKSLSKLDRNVALMKEADNIKNLTSNFSKSVRKWPEFEPILLREYNARKEGSVQIFV